MTIATLTHASLVRPMAAAGLVAMSWLFAASLRGFLRKAGRTDWLARLLNRSGLLAGLVEPSLGQVRTIAGRAVFWAVLLAGLAAALSIAAEDAVAELAGPVLAVLPKAVFAALVLGAFRWLAGYWSRSVLVAAANEGISFPWRWASLVYAGTIFAGIAIVSELTGVATILIRSAFLIVLAGVVLTAVLVLAPALGARLERHGGQAAPGEDGSHR